jgi:predicted phosphodiesterase
MKKIAFISDVHSNYEALKAVLEVINELDVSCCYCLGDIVGYGPEPSLCIKTIRKEKIQSVQGNHDAGATGVISLEFFNPPAREALLWTEKVLSADEKGYLIDLPSIRNLSWGMLVHGSPQKPLYQYVNDTTNAFIVFRLGKEGLYLLGHTHQPALFALTGMRIKVVPVRMERNRNYVELNRELESEMRYIINPGSVGQPRDGDLRASFAVLTLDEDKPVAVTWYRVNYDLEKTRQGILKKGLPEVFADRLLRGR